LFNLNLITTIKESKLYHYYLLFPSFLFELEFVQS